MSEKEPLIIVEGESTGERHPINPDIFKYHGKPLQAWEDVTPEGPLYLPIPRFAIAEVPGIAGMVLNYLSLYGDQLIREGKLIYEDNRRNQNSDK